LDSLKVKDIEYADDTTLYLLGTEQNLNRTYKELSTFCLGTGSKMNWNKTFAVWASRNVKSFSWGTDKSITWIPEGTRVRYLRPLVRFHLPPGCQYDPTPHINQEEVKVLGYEDDITSRKGDNHQPNFVSHLLVYGYMLWFIEEKL